MAKFWELEEPIIKKSEKNVVKIFRKQGRIQVFPRVDSSRYGIGRGATLNLETFHLADLLELKSFIDEAFHNQINKN